MSSVRIRLPLPGPLVKRLRHRPFTAVTWVRFPYGSPKKTPPFWVVFFLVTREGIERPAPVRTRVQKQSGGLFLGRGRFHRFLTAAGMAVGRNRSNMALRSIYPWTIIVFTCITSAWKLIVKTTQHIITLIAAAFNSLICSVARTISALITWYQDRSCYIYNQAHSSLPLYRLLNYIM